MTFPSFRLTFLACCLVLGGGVAIGQTADWPQWRGPDRDGKAAPQSLLQAWPEGGPSEVWRFDAAGRGYSSVAVAGGRLFTQGSDGQRCRVFCLDAANGQPVWSTPYSRTGNDEDYLTGWGAGPRGTPTVDADQVFALSDVGVLTAVDRSSGEIQWLTDLVADHGGSIPKWGYAESPLVDGDRVLVQPGGAGYMIGLDRRTGRKVWSSSGFECTAHYSSIIKGSAHGVDYYVTGTKDGVAGFAVADGRLLFTNPTTGNNVATIPTPVIDGSRVYHTSDYGAGCVLLDLVPGPAGGLDAEQVYHLDGKTMMNHHGGVVVVDGVVYGFTKASGGLWMAQHLDSGDTLWQEKLRPNNSGSVAFADGRLYFYNDEDATIVLVEPSGEAYRPVGSLSLPVESELPRDRGAIWAHPVIADGKLFVRDLDLIYAFDISR